MCEKSSDSWSSYGQLESVFYDYSQDSLNLNFTKGVLCTDSGEFVFTYDWFHSEENIHVPLNNQLFLVEQVHNRNSKNTKNIIIENIFA